MGRATVRLGILVAVVLAVAVTASAANVTVTYQTAASADDTYCGSSWNNVIVSTMYWPYISDARRGFMRWPIQVPPGATIVSACVKIKAASTTANTTTQRMQLVDSDNCPALSTNPYDWAVTGPTVDWPVPAQTQDTWYTSTDIKDIVQALINRPGYQQGNYLGLRGVWASGATAKMTYQWDSGDHSHGPQLEITYSTNADPTAAAGDDQEVTDSDETGYETVMLDGSGSTDSDGSIVSWVWREGETQIATGETVGASLSVGTHTITLTVTDNDSATDQDTVTVVVNAAPAEYPRVIEVPIEWSQDDAMSQPTNAGDTATTLYWPYGYVAQRRSFLRFRSFVPAGATVTSAFVKVRAAAGFATSAALEMQAVDYDTCPEFWPTANPFDYAVAGPSVNWTITGAWTAGQWYGTEAEADIATILQAFIERQGYQFGESFLGLRGIGTNGVTRSISSWNTGDHSGAPKLEVTWTGGDRYVDLWMADPEVRLGQKIYCQVFNARPTDKVRLKVDGTPVQTVANFLPAAVDGKQPGRVEVMVTADYRNLDAGQHAVEVEILTAADVEVASASRSWTKLHNGIGPVQLDENNAVCVDGEPFFPVTPFGLGISHWPTYANCTNVMMGQGFSDPKTLAAWQDYLKKADIYGFRVIGPLRGPYWPGGVTYPSSAPYPTEIDDACQVDYINGSKYDPALFMYHWQDEPNLHTPPIDGREVRAWTDACHDLDTRHPTFTTLLGDFSDKGSTFPTFGSQRTLNYCFLYNDRYTGAGMGASVPFGRKTVVFDVMSFDYYPYEYALKIPTSSLADYATVLDRARDWNYNLVTIMTWIETCDVHPEFATESPQWWTPCITATQLKNLVWLSVIHGAKGINWFHYFGATPPENFAVMNETLAWTTDLAKVILGDPEVSVNVEKDELSEERVDMMTREKDGVLYLFAAHLEEDGNGQTVRFLVDGLAAGTLVCVYGESRNITAQNGYFEDSFGPLGVHIYYLPLSGNHRPAAVAGDDIMVVGAQNVSLDATGSTDCDGTVTAYQWKEGQTVLSTSATPTLYLDAGVHTLTLTVTDDLSATADDTVVVTVNSAAIACQIAASADDTYSTSSSSMSTATTFFAPYITDDRLAFCRWAVSIPAGSTITGATLKLKSDGTESTTADLAWARVRRVDADNCPAFASPNPFSSAVSAAYVDWAMDFDLIQGTWYSSPDLKSLVQAFIDRPGYAAGNYLGLRISQAMPSSGYWKRFYQYNNHPADGAILEVTYIENGVGMRLPELVITAGLDFSWVYPNTPIATQNRHHSVLTVDITDGSMAGEAYTITVGESGGPVANFQVAQGTAVAPGTPQAVSVFGGNRVTTNAGDYMLTVTVTGTPGAQTATASVPLTLRLLGDIDGDGSMTASDKLEMNKPLNGLAVLPGITLRNLDLTGDGTTVDAEDRLVINQVLNGLSVP